MALIESSTKLGGLLGVAHSWDRYNFDYGTHFISTTGIQEIDDFLWLFVMFAEQEGRLPV